MVSSVHPLRLGVNLDHIATLRNARGEDHPALRRAVEVALKAGVDGITLHLREDRRHIVDLRSARTIAASGFAWDSVES